ncbi:MAG: ABC transporter substrate-binding protein [Fidelibacterota bacterium]
MVVFRYLALAGLIFVLSCGRKGESDRGLREYPGEQAVPGGVLVVGINGEPDALNPLTALLKPARDIIHLLFRRLADINEDLATVTPQLARGWEFSLDSLTLTFHLRTGVLWHDGTPFTSRDVVFTYRLQVDPDVAWDGFPFKQNIVGVEAPDDSTVIFTFREKTPTLLMDAVEGYIVPAHILEGVSPDEIRQAGFNHHPVGCGPFRFVGWKPQQSVTLEKFDRYYRKGRPYLDRVVFRVVPDRVSLWHQLLSGDIDFMEGVPPANFNRLVEEWEKKKTPILPVSFLGRQYDFIGWNLIDPASYPRVMEAYRGGDVDAARHFVPHPLFGSRKVRAALTMAMDRTRIARVVNAGLAQRMDGPVPLIWWCYNPEANTDWPHNPRRAMQYLREEGWTDSDGDGVLDRDGIPFRFEMVTNTGNERREMALTIVQEQLREIGVDMTPRLVEPGLLFGRMLSRREFDAALIGWDVALKVDLVPLFHSSALISPFNFVSFRSEEFDRWHDLAVATFDRQAAQAYWDSIAHFLSGELPYTWLYYRMENAAYHFRIKGARIDKRGPFFHLEEWWIPPEERTRIAGRPTADR